MERAITILNLLSSNDRIKVPLLAEMLDISQVTLRRDLDNLERRGIIRRTHGYASLNGADDTCKRLAYNYSVKRRIAKAAVQTIDEGETIMIESGSCCVLLAEELAHAKKNVTIISNSVIIANCVGKMPGIKVILLGGYYQPESQVMIGPMTIQCANYFYSDKFFIGTDGYIPDFGFTGRDHLRVETATDLAKQSNKIFILTESAKFQRRGVYNLFQINDLTGVFTDEKIPKEAEDALIKNNVRLHKVPADPE